MTVELYRAFRNSILAQEKSNELADKTLKKEYINKIESSDNVLSKIKDQKVALSINAKIIDPALYEN